ncbi:MAG: hypothetical protein LBT80_07495 [Lactobacillaceae bacterium]|jgi:hypothetical protein|nr:hypothetical protein [Lactobacillaceae bacterium]
MIEPFVERGVRNIALKSVWWVVLSGGVTVLLLVGIGVWWFTSRDMLNVAIFKKWISQLSQFSILTLLVFGLIRMLSRSKHYQG